VNGFKWDSEDQKKGYHALRSWLKSKGLDDEKVRGIDLFFIQKDHDSHVYWVELMGTQIKDLQDQLVRQSEKIVELTKKLQETKQ
jgi:hypothetical protein